MQNNNAKETLFERLKNVIKAEYGTRDFHFSPLLN
jgi:hypothetical protein